MHISSLSSPSLILYLVIAAVATFLAWRTGSGILRSKSSDPSQLRKRLLIPLLILVVVIALFQLMGIFFER